MEKRELLDVGDEVQVYGQTFIIKEIVNDYALLEQDGEEYDLVDIELLDIS